MIGIVIVSHAALADELLHAAESILGSLEAVETVSISREMALEVAKEKLHLAVTLLAVDGDGVLILTDMFGGTPTNISVEYLREAEVEILTGVNLPMLIKAVSARTNQDLDQLTTTLKVLSQNAIVRPSELLRSGRPADAVEN